MNTLGSSDGGKDTSKVKKTRKRLRLSCVECTKRRQKCDRRHPCSLCVARGIEHLCRWENVPVARPAPARPHESAFRRTSSTAAPQDQETIILELKHRLATVENELEQVKGQRTRSDVGTPGFSSGSRTISTPPTDASMHDSTSPFTSGGAYSSETSSRRHSPTNAGAISDYPSLHLPESLAILDPAALSFARLQDEDYETISRLAQLSMAHHGEFIGRGSLICALHSVTANTYPRFLYAKSTDPMSGYRASVQKFSTIPFVGRVEDLMPYLPSMLVVETLTSAFFDQVNWRYGIPEEWFRGAKSLMWASLHHTSPVTLNTNWLVLLFAVLASAPRASYEELEQHHHSNGLKVLDSDDYFMCAMMARRLVEDEYLNAPNPSLMVSAADGTVLGCLATPLLCDYLARSGRVSEAWKLVGHAIRNAEAVGMHRDPDWRLWQMMSEDEKLLRRSAWWGLFIADKTYAYILGRTQELRRADFDVEYFARYNRDGSRNRFGIGQNVLISLMELVGASLEKCFNVHNPDCDVYLDMDQRFLQWEETIPEEYRMDFDIQFEQEFSLAEQELLSRQRYTIHSWYLVGRLKLHLGSSTGRSGPPQSPQLLRQNFTACILVALQIIRYQTSAYNTPVHDAPGTGHPGSSWLFEGCFSLFEATVALCTTLNRFPWQEKVAEAKHAIDSALAVFSSVTRSERGKTAETAARAIEVLSMIRIQQWVDMDSSYVPPKTTQDQPDGFDHSSSRYLDLSNSMPTSILKQTFSTSLSSPQFHLSSVRDNGDTTHMPDHANLGASAEQTAV